MNEEELRLCYKIQECLENLDSFWQRLFFRKQLLDKLNDGVVNLGTYIEKNDRISSISVEYYKDGLKVLRKEKYL